MDLDGAAYCMGSLKQDRWYLYTLHSPVAPQRNVDHTLEILMTDLPEDVCAIFTKEVCADGPECTKVSALYRFHLLNRVVELYGCAYCLSRSVYPRIEFPYQRLQT